MGIAKVIFSRRTATNEWSSRQQEGSQHMMHVAYSSYPVKMGIGKAFFWHPALLEIELRSRAVAPVSASRCINKRLASFLRPIPYR
jgi:hypothetical protein